MRTQVIQHLGKRAEARMPSALDVFNLAMPGISVFTGIRNGRAPHAHQERCVLKLRSLLAHVIPQFSRWNRIDASCPTGKDVAVSHIADSAADRSICSPTGTPQPVTMLAWASAQDEERSLGK